MHAVLQQLALPDKDRVLWADAICISQINSPDNLEKGEQIKLMPDIYRFASRVQVYLGSESAQDVSAIELIGTIADYFDQLDGLRNPVIEIGASLALRDGLVLPPSHDKQWAALRAFLRRPWFRRIWVIQEFVYATDVSVICGHHEIDWHKLWLMSTAYIHNRRLFAPQPGQYLSGWYRQNEYLEAHEGAKALNTITGLRMQAWGWRMPQYQTLAIYNYNWKPSTVALSKGKDLRHIKHWDKFNRDHRLQDCSAAKSSPLGKDVDILKLLRRTENFMATQPVDRFYALLGLAADAESFQLIYSDNQSLAVVSTRFAAALIAKGRLSDVLAAAGIRSDKPSAHDTPSWVPDWSKTWNVNDAAPGFNAISKIQIGRAHV